MKSRRFPENWSRRIVYMIVGVVRVSIHFPGAGSLKAKRKILLSLKDKIKNKFNVSVAELEDNDKWQIGVIGVAVISNEKAHANSVLSKVMDMINGRPEIVVTDMQLEWM